MKNIVFLILRQMRRPLLTLIVAYAVAILGLSLIPGRDADGNVWHMSIFHSAYVISYVATTIGFGEIPYEFTNAQRLWVTLCIYLTVIAWLYAIGTILSLLQDKTFRQALVERRFTRQVRAQREPFYLVCGYGETGSALVEALTNRGQHAVVVDIDEARSAYIQLQDLREYVPALHGDARRPEHLVAAGLDHPACAGVVALTNDNAANLKVAITAKLLHPELSVICRADAQEVEANMASFGTDYIIDPFETFSAYLSTAMQMPCLYLLQRWLTGEDDIELSEPIYPPHEGHWIVCGYGRFGKAVYARLKREGVRPVVIEATPERTGTPPEGIVRGWGTEADTLLAAGVDRAVGLVAGTHDDANNLSIVMTARDLNRSLFVIVRQNHRDNEAIVRAARADMVMHPSSIIAEKIQVLLATPYLYEFFKLAQYKDNAWACQLVSRITSVAKHLAPTVRTLRIDAERACALNDTLNGGTVVTLGDLMRDPWDRERPLNLVPLLLARSAHRVLLPDEDEVLAPGDRLLMCGDPGALTRLEWALCHVHTLEYVRTGVVSSHGWLWRRWQRRRAGQA